MAFLTLENVSVGYSRRLIEDMDSQLHLGEICLLIGNNGVGKTTLIKSLLGQQNLLDGKILLNTSNLSNLSPVEIAQNISVVFANAQIPSNFTVYDLVALGKYIHYPYYFKLKKEDEAVVEKLIEDLQLSHYRNHPLTKLSDGNLQKAFIARALAQNTPMIILDEPTTHLDEKNKIMILTLLRKLAKEHNKLILFSSHDWRLAKEFSDKIWWLNAGRLYAGLTEDIILSNEKLTLPQLFTLNPNFRAPNITAPDLEKEMLYSALQKNFDTDLSDIQIAYEEKAWKIKNNDKYYPASTVEEVLKILKSFN